MEYLIKFKAKVTNQSQLEMLYVVVQNTINLL